MRIRHAESLPPFQKNSLILGFQHEIDSRASRTEVVTEDGCTEVCAGLVG